MKLILKPKTIFLLLLFISQFAKAQGTEKALEAAAQILFVFAGIVLAMLITLVIFLVNRNRIAGIISAIFGFLILLAGVGLSIVLGNHGSSGFESISYWIMTAGAINLILVFAFSWVFPKKSKVEISDPYPDADLKIQADPSGERIIKWLSLLLAVWFFYDLYQEFQFLKHTSLFSSAYESSALSGMDLYFTIMQIWPLILLLICLSFFITRNRTGWTLLVFYSVYIITGFIFFMFRMAFFSSPYYMETPAAILIAQFVIVSFFSTVLFLILKPNVRHIFSVDQKSSTTTVAVCASIVVLLLLVTNLMF